MVALAASHVVAPRHDVRHGSVPGPAGHDRGQAVYSRLRGGAVPPALRASTSQALAAYLLAINSRSRRLLLRALHLGRVAPTTAHPDRAAAPTDLATLPAGKHRKKRVLILISDTGGGHRASAQALQEVLKEQCSEIEISIVDVWTAYGPWPYNGMVSAPASSHPSLLAPRPHLLVRPIFRCGTTSSCKGVPSCGTWPSRRRRCNRLATSRTD